MKNLKRNVILSGILTIAIIMIMAGGVHAAPTLLFDNGNSTTNTTTNETNTTLNTTTNTTANETNTTVTLNTTTNTSANRVTVNNVDADKDLPQTGENDVYIVSAVGAVALLIGGVAYIKSRKYDM